LIPRLALILTCGAALLLGSCALVGGLDGTFLPPGHDGGAGGTSSQGGAGGASSQGGAGGTSNPWAYSFGDEGKHIIFSIAATADGGVVAAGVFTGKLMLGSLTANNNKACTSDDGAYWLACPDAFVLKLDAAGNLLWADVITSPHEIGVQVPRLAVNPVDGNVVVSFECRDASVGGKTLATQGAHDLCLAQWGPDGTFKDAVALGNTLPKNLQVGPLAVTAEAIFITVSTGDMTIGQTSFSQGVNLLRFNHDLTLNSHSLLFDSNDAGVHEMASDGNGYLYMIGNFWGPLTWPDRTTSTPAPMTVESFISRWTLDGQLKWHRESQSMTGANVEHHRIIVDGDLLLVVGIFRGTTNLGAGNMTDETSPNCTDDYGNVGNCYDGYIAMYQALTGDAIRTAQLASSQDVRLTSLATKSGRIGVGAFLYGSKATFGGETLSIPDAGKSQILLAELSEGLEMRGYDVLGSSATDIVAGLAYSAQGQFLAGGLIGSTTTLANETLTVSQAPNGFILSRPSF
jgi:hypothetical protein